MSLAKITIVSGYDIIEKLQLTKDGAAFNIPAASTVQAAIVSRDKTKLLAGPFPLLSTDEGAAWSASLLSLIVDGSLLNGLEKSFAKIEIRVDDGENAEPWFFDAQIEQGNIPKT